MGTERGCRSLFPLSPQSPRGTRPRSSTGGAPGRSSPFCSARPRKGGARGAPGGGGSANPRSSEGGGGREPKGEGLVEGAAVLSAAALVRAFSDSLLSLTPGQTISVHCQPAPFHPLRHPRHGPIAQVEAAARESEESLRKELAAVQAALSDAQRERRAAEERGAEVSRRDAERAREGEARAEELARRLATCEDSLTSLRREREALVALLSALQQRGPRAGMHEEAGSDEDLQGGPEGGRGPVEGLGSKPLGDHWAGAATVHARATGEKDGAGAGRPALPAPRPGVLPPGLLERVRALELLGAEMGFAHFGQSC